VILFVGFCIRFNCDVLIVYNVTAILNSGEVSATSASVIDFSHAGCWADITIIVLPSHEDLHLFENDIRLAQTRKVRTSTILNFMAFNLERFKMMGYEIGSGLLLFFKH
jgi:hypothetical protein